MSDAPPRGETHLDPPPADPADLVRFPALRVRGRWFRAHVERSTDGDRGCWWFSSVGPVPAASGRFDLPDPRGTCYLAVDEEVAARERVGTQLRRQAGRETVLASVLTDDDGRRVIVTAVELQGVRAANVAVKAAQPYVTRSLWAGTGIYAVTQAWARSLYDAGFDAIRYPPRFTLGRRARALAIFGTAGQPDPPRPVGSHRPLAQVLGDLGVRLIDRPVSAPVTLDPSDPPPPL